MTEHKSEDKPIEKGLNVSCYYDGTYLGKFFVDKKEDAPNIDWILDKARKCHEVFDIDGLIIDPYNEVSAERVTMRED